MLEACKQMPHNRRIIWARIASGGILTEERFTRWALRDGSLVDEAGAGHCRHCHLQAAETEAHIYWECPAWRAARRLSCPADSVPCFCNCGLAAQGLAFTVGQLALCQQQMVNIVLMRAAEKERLGLVETGPGARCRVLTAQRVWVPAKRISVKRPRADIQERAAPAEEHLAQRDSRGRLSRRRTNLDEHQGERDRLMNLVLRSRVPQPELVCWQLPALKRRTIDWIRDAPAHFQPCVRHLEALPPDTGALHWRCLTCGTVRSHEYRKDLVARHLVCAGVPNAASLPRLSVDERRKVVEVYGNSILDYGDVLATAYLFTRAVFDETALRS
eukprot:6488064-Amphidinium_carterae.1